VRRWPGPVTREDLERASVAFGPGVIEGGAFGGHPRSVEGVLVLWGEPFVSRLGHRVVVASPDALRCGGEVPVVLGHNLGRRVGRVVAVQDSPGGRLVRVLLDDSQKGRMALQAAHDGTLDAFSLGCAPSEAHVDEVAGWPARIVTAGRWREVTLCDRGAVSRARIAAVGGMPIGRRRWEAA
jgi:hypothetical protein